MIVDESIVPAERDNSPLVKLPLRQLRTGEVEPDTINHYAMTLESLDFNLLIKKNPFECDIKLYRAEGKIPSRKPPQDTNKSISDVDYQNKQAEIMQKQLEQLAKLKETKENGLARKMSESADSDPSKGPGELRRAYSLGRSAPGQVKGILKLGARSKYAKEYVDRSWSNPNSRSNSPNRNIQDEARKKGFIQSNSFDVGTVAANNKTNTTKVSTFKRSNSTKALNKRK
jgi:hypothetical protein